MANINPYAYTLESMLQSQQVDEHDLPILRERGETAKVKRTEERMETRAKEIARVRRLYHEADGDVDIMFQVMTPAEIERVFGLQPGTVRMAIRMKRIPARKSDDRTWLVLRADAERQWGQRKSD